jgi:acylphosphatase
MEERRFRVRGRVQGVGYRWWTRGQAQRLGIAGTVRNCPDGSVEVDARGSAEAIGKLRDALRKGPPGASVSSVDEEDPVTIPESGFHIIH